MLMYNFHIEKVKWFLLLWVLNRIKQHFSFNSVLATGIFMCPRNASVLRDGHVCVPADVVQSNEVNSEAKQAFGVNSCQLSSNKCRPHLSTYITRRGRQEEAVIICELQGGGQTRSFSLNAGNKWLLGFT